ncbi:hypothetical protein C8Q76DRAFT_124371 [Earliella scabrosa]|nr:hypothetical protein C8Q76DRAFT_124371 [Earliella scabrosa]
MDFEAVFMRFVQEDEAVAICSTDPLVAAVRAPVRVALHVAVHALRDVARTHGVVLPRDAMRDVRGIVSLLSAHECRAACSDVVALFSFNAIRRGAGSAPASQTAVFPPRVCGADERADIVRQWCRATSWENVYESPCAVCARLTLDRELRCISTSPPLRRLPVANILPKPS